MTRMERLGWTWAEIIALTKNRKPVEVEMASLRYKKNIPDGTDLFAPPKELLDAAGTNYEVSTCNPFSGGPAISQCDLLICQVVVEPKGTTVDLVLNAYEPPICPSKGVPPIYYEPPGIPMVFSPEDVAKTSPGIWISRGVSVEAKLRDCKSQCASVRLMGWEVVAKRGASH